MIDKYTIKVKDRVLLLKDTETVEGVSVKSGTRGNVALITSNGILVLWPGHDALYSVFSWDSDSVRSLNVLEQLSEI